MKKGFPALSVIIISLCSELMNLATFLAYGKSVEPIKPIENVLIFFG
jgi:hypothetical protein